MIAGRPLGEPVAWLGPFVMNTKAEIAQAIEDRIADEARSGRDRLAVPVVCDRHLIRE